MKTLKLLLSLMMVVTPLSLLAQSKGEMPFSGSPETNKLLRKSWVALADFNIEQGNNYTRQVLAQDPDIGMAYASLFTQDLEEQKENLRKAEKAKLSQDEQMFVEGLKARLSKESPQQYFDPLLKKYPKDLYLQLWILFNFDNTKRSIEIAEALIKRNPKFAPAYNMLGYLFMDQHDMAKAGSHFDKYIALQPNLANPYDSKGDYFMRMGKTEEAIPLYEKAVALGMKQSAEKVERARAMIKYPKPSEEDAAIVKGIIVERFEAMKTGDVDGMLKNYSQQATEIFASQRVNVGLPNIKRRMSEVRGYGAHLNTNFDMGSINGTGPIAIARGRTDFTWKVLSTGAEEEQILNVIFLLRKEKDNGWKILATHFYKPDDMQAVEAEDKKNISKLLHDWETILVTAGLTPEKRIAAFAKLYSEQAMEIFPNEVSNIGIANLRSRWQQISGGKTERNTLGSMGIEVSGRRAVAWGIGDQHYYPKGSEELTKSQFPWAMILTKEDDDTWRILAIHWGS